MIHQLQRVNQQERMKNRAGIKALIRCTCYLMHNHIAHVTQFEKLVDLVVMCEGESLKYHMEKAAVYTSHIAVVDFVEALGTWVEESTLKRLHRTSYNSIVAIFLLDYTLPQAAKLSKTVQTEHLDLSIISGLVDSTIHILDDAALPSAN